MAPARPLLLLTVAVLAGHLFLLRPPDDAVQPTPEPARAFLTRTVAAQPPPAAVPLDASPVRPQAAPKPPVPSRAVARPAPAAVLAAVQHEPEPAATATAAQVVPAQPPAMPQPRLAPPAPAGPVAIPGSVRLQYQVEIRRAGLSLAAHSELRWRQDGEHYEARLEVSAPLLRPRTQHSTGRITAEGLAPLRFSDKGRGEEATHFDRDRDKLSFSSNRPDAPLLPGAQDRLSVLVQLGAMIAGAPAKFPPGTSITIQTAGTREAEPWVFIVEADEQLQLPGGKLVARKLTRSPRKEYDLKVELWLAPGMDYVPVRLRLTQPNGDSVDQQWSSTDRG
jgi:hypothetical protein